MVTAVQTEKIFVIPHTAEIWEGVLIVNFTVYIFLHILSKRYSIKVYYDSAKYLRLKWSMALISVFAFLVPHILESRKDCYVIIKQTKLFVNINFGIFLDYSTHPQKHLRVNPRLAEPFSFFFFVTRLPKGGGYHPLWIWNWHAQSKGCWVP